MDATFPQINWRRYAKGIDHAAACSFILSAALTLTVYVADKLALQWLTHVATWVSLLTIPVEFYLAVMSTAYLWNTKRFLRWHRDALSDKVFSLLQLERWKTSNAAMAAWPMTAAVAAACITCWEVTAWPAGATTILAGVFGVLTGCLGFHWFVLRRCSALMRTIEEQQAHLTLYKIAL
ncbi:hypothetical protein [Burkholderia sp. Bp9012]|uniref:hypothetical protein n=1 Tax=Burkholderia sp. Bp9012 TaxID=2184562 RepID=UPI000F5977C9|nr:hypothetical protein [Burkholderia sp. Bp9012]